MTGLFQKIFGVYKSGGSQERDPRFWIACAQAQIKEAEDDFKASNYDHMAKEFADLAFVAIDGLRKMGYNALQVMDYRIEENAKKDLSGRTKEFYLAKANGQESA